MTPLAAALVLVALFVAPALGWALLDSLVAWAIRWRKRRRA